MHTHLRRQLVWWAQIAGLCAMAWFVWTNSIDPRLRFESFASILGQALGFVLFAWAASAIVTFAIYTILPGERGCGPGAAAMAWSSVPGIWFAPATILLSTLSAAGLAIGLALILNTTRLLVSQWAPVRAEARPTPARFPGEIGTAFLGRSTIPALLSAGAAEAGVISVLWRNPFAAAGYFALAVAVLVAHSITREAYTPGKTPELPQSSFGTILTILLALSVSVGSIQIRVIAGAGPGNDSASGTQVTRLHSPRQTATAGIGGDGFPGVILRSPERAKPALTAPIPPSIRDLRVASTAMSIPFTGEYWMFQWPWTHPPDGSVIEHGTPRELSYRTTNGRAMEMAADQRLDPPLDLSCCSVMQLIISSGEPDSSALLEIVLRDGGREENLGMRAATGGVLHYPLHGLARCDEIRVIYHRGSSSTRSSKIAIERFVFE